MKTTDWLVEDTAKLRLPLRVSPPHCHTRAIGLLPRKAIDADTVRRHGFCRHSSGRGNRLHEMDPAQREPLLRRAFLLQVETCVTTEVNAVEKGTQTPVPMRAWPASDFQMNQISRDLPNRVTVLGVHTMCAAAVAVHESTGDSHV